MSFEFPTSFRFQFAASRYIIGLSWTSVYKVIVNSIFSELRIKILSVSIYYGTQSDIREKCYCRLNLKRVSVFILEHLSINCDTLSGIREKSYSRLIFLRVSIFNLQRLDLLRDSTEHPCLKLLSFLFAQSF